ncbi:MAG: hypothetical protein IPP05_06195 [Cytophagaceae bacterium]|nr:hypothetical protein [Cytophagaceae bacterium]
MAAIARFDLGKKSLVIEAHLALYGSLASQEVGERIVSEINRMWNQPKAAIEVDGTLFDIVFHIDFGVYSQNDTLKMFSENNSHRVNFIRIEEKNVAERSMMGFGLGENSGHWLITDQLGDSTTAAHEFGHALGLPHPDELDCRNSGNPPIMAPRGTIVDADFQWNPLAEPGMTGGTMRPIHRRVRAYEVLNVVKDKILGTTDSFTIGKLSPHLYDEIGQPAALSIS